MSDQRHYEELMGANQARHMNLERAFRAEKEAERLRAEVETLKAEIKQLKLTLGW